MFSAAPARAAETFQAVRLDGAVNTTNPYKGLPGPRLDGAWEDLYDGVSKSLV